MNAHDHKYYVEKIEEQDRELRVYRDCFLDMMKWFNKNRKHLKKVPVSERPRIPKPDIK